MPEPRDIPGWLNSTLEIGPALAFFLCYMWVKDDSFTIGGTEYGGLVVVTAAFIPIFLAAIATLWALTGRISPMQLVTAGMVVIFGGLTIWFNDERFVKIRPTLVYGTMATILLLGLWRGRSLLALVLSDALPLTDDAWRVLTRRMALFLLAMAGANELVWRTQTTAFWVTFETFVLPIALAAFIFWQISSLSEPEEGEDA
ncbi:inner membrane-spanning protein YciB [uncultured Jannaschia sp.]|uniref:inner membrane-spanning protein YciB n=1 Tax=uncultured Jannaschia sp. TaxID=293347 RepID=UPI0026133928|nr:inner membrane-spanning protein YciB [uncultured Jannaschia sp.]